MKLGIAFVLAVVSSVGLAAMDNNATGSSLKEKELELEAKRLELERMKLALERDKLKLAQGEKARKPERAAWKDSNGGLLGKGYGEWSLITTQSASTSKEKVYSDMETTDYALQYSYYDDEYIAFVAYAMLPKQEVYTVDWPNYGVSGDRLTGTVKGEGSAFGVGYLPKLYRSNNIFVGPGLIYRVAEVTRYTDLEYTDGTTSDTYHSKNSENDSDLSLDLVLGYEYGTKSLATLSYGVSDDLLEQEDHDECEDIDHHTIEAEVIHAVNQNISLRVGYSRDTSNCDESVFEKNTDFKFGIGFFY